MNRKQMLWVSVALVPIGIFWFFIAVHEPSPFNWWFVVKNPDGTGSQYGGYVFFAIGCVFTLPGLGLNLLNQGKRKS